MEHNFLMFDLYLVSGITTFLSPQNYVVYLVNCSAELIFENVLICTA
jgi:hypothetical protein